jgi:hypothetical protein
VNDGVGIRALTNDGQQTWVWPAPGVNRYPTLIAADNQGGALYFADSDSANQFQSWCYFGRVDENGNETWQYQETNCREDYAIGPDGTIYLAEDDFQNTGWNQVTALDPNTGNIKFSIPMPRGSASIGNNFSFVVGNNPVSTNPPYCTPGTSAPLNTMPGSPYGPPGPVQHGLLSVSSDGTVYLPIAASGNGVLDAAGCDPGPDPTNPYFINITQATGTGTSYPQLMVINPDGTSSIQQVDSYTESYTNWYSPQNIIFNPPVRFNGLLGRAIPDGQGAAFIANYQTLYHGNSSGFTFASLPITLDDSDNYYRGTDPLLLGEDGTAYLAGSSAPNGVVDTVLSINSATGTPNWSASVSNPILNTVLSDGGIVLQAGSSGLTQLDGTGQSLQPLGNTPPALMNADICISGCTSNGSIAGLISGSFAAVSASLSSSVAAGQYSQTHGGTDARKGGSPDWGFSERAIARILLGVTLNIGSSRRQAPFLTSPTLSLSIKQIPILYHQMESPLPIIREQRTSLKITFAFC